MGAYVNPPTDKRAWLEENKYGETMYRTPEWDKEFEALGMALVCLVDNGAFTAAGIAFDEPEFGAFNDPSDTRLKTWFWVELDKLKEVSNVADYL